MASMVTIKALKSAVRSMRNNEGCWCGFGTQIANSLRKDAGKETSHSKRCKKISKLMGVKWNKQTKK